MLSVVYNVDWFHQACRCLVWSTMLTAFIRPSDALRGVLLSSGLQMLGVVYCFHQAFRCLAWYTTLTAFIRPSDAWRGIQR